MSALERPLQLSIGGICVAVHSDHLQVMRHLSGNYAAWLGDGPAACHVLLVFGGGEQPRQRPSPSASFAADGRCQVTAPGYLGQITADARSATLQLAVPNAADIDYFLRAVVALVAFERGGLLVHGSGFLRCHQAVVFSGRSGIGKSTSVRVSMGQLDTAPLGDDLILLLPAGDRWRAFGTPFWNPETPQAWRSSQTGSGPLAGLFRLVQDTSVFVEPLGVSGAVAGLLSDLPIVPLDGSRVPALMQRLRRLAAAVPVGRLHFRPDPDFWSAVDEYIHRDHAA